MNVKLSMSYVKGQLTQFDGSFFSPMLLLFEIFCVNIHTHDGENKIWNVHLLPGFSFIFVLATTSLQLRQCLQLFSLAIFENIHKHKQEEKNKGLQNKTVYVCWSIPKL